MNTLPGVSFKRKSIKWSPRSDLNRRPPPYHGGALPTELRGQMVEGEGFEPSKAPPTDLQSAPFGHSGTPPKHH